MNHNEPSIRFWELIRRWNWNQCFGHIIINNTNISLIESSSIYLLLGSIYTELLAMTLALAMQKRLRRHH